MTTVLDENVYNIALEGTFDDAQALVKAMFRDRASRRDLQLTAVNSINWARVMAQIVYYFTAALRLGAPERAVSFSVPTGNFGDVLAGWCARQMGLPIKRLVVATNTNDILARTLRTGEYVMAGVTPTISPSMDIEVSSNFERLLFESHDRDPGVVRAMMGSLVSEGRFGLSDSALTQIREVFGAHTLHDDGTLRVMTEVHERTGMLIDPHTAIGVAGARAHQGSDGTPMVVLSTAHAAKFPDAVEQATQVRPGLPPHLSDLFERPERYTVLPNDRGVVESFIRERTRVGRAG
jgi:threonine synthase